MTALQEHVRDPQWWVIETPHQVAVVPLDSCLEHLWFLRECWCEPKVQFEEGWSRPILTHNRPQ